MSKNKLIVPEAQQAINNLKMEIAQDLGLPTIKGMTSEMYPAIVNGLSVREMVRRGEQILINKNRKMPSDRDIY
ncbi:MAG: small, acid-soluble spore protein, alpha/beta type [Tissierellia bacterium]|nr:small, acid-soluble spore protein, alpha/beta type [Tissierellia bacterium]MDD4780804.1 small, acid-soluble spore protein, alpha/beta type [Tissierellia bacterium]